MSKVFAQPMKRGLDMPRSSTSPSRGARSLAPREHGAYGQLGLPLAAALAMGRPTPAALGIAAAAVAAFFAHEPALVLAGQRGTRAQREDGGRARRRLGLLGGVTVIAGGVGLYFAPPAAQLAAILPAVLAVALGPMVRRGEERTAPGELLAAATLAAVGSPVAIASGASLASACSAWAAWCVVFGASTLVVRGVIAHARAPMAWPRRLAAPAVAVAVGAALTAGGVLAPAAAIGAAPMLALAAALAIKPPGPRSLKRVGWALVASSVSLAVALAVGARL